VPPHYRKTQAQNALIGNSKENRSVLKTSNSQVDRQFLDLSETVNFSHWMMIAFNVGDSISLIDRLAKPFLGKSTKMIAQAWMHQLRSRYRDLSESLKQCQFQRRIGHSNPNSGFEVLESRICLTSLYDFDIIAKSGGTLTGFTQFPSVNDLGQVAFISSLSTGGEGIFVGAGGGAAPTQLSGSGNSNTTYLASVQINNAGRVLATERDFSPNFRSLNLWDVSNPGSSQAVAGSGVAGTSILTFASLSNQANAMTGAGIVFGAIISPGATVTIQQPMPPLGFGTTLASYNGPGVGLQPMVADNGMFVYRAGNNAGNTDNAAGFSGPAPDAILLQSSNGASQIIASSANFSGLGGAPGISDDGQIVTFFGNLTQAGANRFNSTQTGLPQLAPGPGIFASLATATGRALVRVAGLTNNGLLDPGERWDNVNNNNSEVWTSGSVVVDPGEDQLGFSSFLANTRVGVNRLELNSSFYRIVFEASDDDGVLGLFSSSIRTDGTALFAPVAVIKAGDVIPGLGSVETFSLGDPVNNSGKFTFWTQTSGGQAIISGSGYDPVRQTLAPWGTQQYAPVQLENFINTLSTGSAQHPADLDNLDDLIQLDLSGKLSIRNKGCLLTSLSMALDRLGLVKLTPEQLLRQLDAINGFDPIQFINHKPDGTPKFKNDSGIKVFSFKGADLQWPKLAQLIPSLQAERIFPGSSNFTTELQAALKAGKPVLVNIHNGGHWALAHAINGDTLEYIDPEFSTSTVYQSMSLSSEALGIKSAVILSKGQSQGSFWIQSQSPIEYVLTSPSGARLGFNPVTHTSYSEIEGASYGELFPILDPDDEYSEAELDALRPFLPRLGTGPQLEFGTYQLDVFGIGTGPFTVNFFGADAVGQETTFTTSNSITPGDQQTFTFTVLEQSSSPIANGDSAVTSPSGSVQIPVLDNDIASEGIDPTSVTVVTPPSFGIVDVNPVTGVITYSAAPGVGGFDSFTYTVLDNLGVVSNTATVTLSVVALPIEVVDDTVVTDQNLPISISVLANDRAGTGNLDPDTLTVVTDPTNGTAIVDSANRRIIYQPRGGFAGTDTITYRIQNDSGDAGTATVSISVQDPVPVQAPGLFTGAVSYPLEQSVYSTNTVILRDFSGDLIPDLMTVGSGGINQISVLKGRGDGTFFSTPILSTVSDGFPRTAAAGDFNGDGKLDLLVSFLPNDSSAFTLELLVGQGDGTFLTSNLYSVQKNPTAMIAKDVNGDGKMDAVIVATGPNPFSTNENRICVLLGKGNGTFQAPLTIVTSDMIHSLVMDDFNGDGKQDLVVSIDNGSLNGAVKVWLGNGTGTFQSPVEYPLLHSLWAPASYTNNNSLTSGDFNGDGFVDLAASMELSDNGAAHYTINVLLSNGNGTFQPAIDYTDFPIYADRSEADSFPLIAGDFNGDGKADLAAGGLGSHIVNVVMSSGDGLAPSIRSNSIGAGALAMATGDLNGDGRADLVTANEGGFVSVFLANADGRFSRSTRFEHQLGRDEFEVPLSPYLVQAGDVDGDHRPDLILSTSHLLSVILSNGDGTFQPSIPSPSPVFAFGSLTMGDFDGDQIPDLVGVYQGVSVNNLGIDFSGGAISIMFGNGDGSFPTSRKLAISDEAPGKVVSADFNKDGKLDIASTDLNNGEVAIRLGNGNGTFQPPLRFSVGDGPLDLAIDDFDKDGNADLVTANLGGAFVNGGLTVLFGRRDGTFLVVPLSVPPGSPGSVRNYSVATADFNGDGLSDIVTDGSVLLNHGARLFEEPIDSVWPRGNDLQTGDFNDDGRADVMVVAPGAGTLFMLGTGNGRFLEPIYYSTDPSYGQVAALADFSGDGVVDVALPWGRYQIEVLIGATPVVTVNNAPIAVADTASATEASGIANGTIGVNATGNVLDNDIDVDSGDTKTVSAVRFEETIGMVGKALSGSFGALTLNSNGTFTYVINNSNTVVEALRTSSDHLTETFQYTTRDIAGATASTTLVITIAGANDAPAAVADIAEAVVIGTAGSGASGNVLTNDTDVDVGDTKAVTSVRFGANLGSVGAGLAGSFGALTLNANGTFTYIANTANPDVVALNGTSNTLTEAFQYTLRDTTGATSATTLTIPIRAAIVIDAPKLNLEGPSAQWTKKHPPVPVLPQATVMGSNLAGGTLTVSANVITSRKRLFDQLGIPSFGSFGNTATPQVSNGRLILQITLRDTATAGAIQAFLRGITFATKGKGLTSPSRTLIVTLAAADGTSSTISQTVNLHKK
jgi:VCBS repeat-containing protein